ncbi:hypothetical protein F9L33_14065 [Amylibacter sp. SFDW26]|uniref:hypothetical protein n=1 Tax=Amylibacter sp. SFDW26 TaxID=2652722 RepID=UPI0012616386|nr:hypothetical protein [Amylibacter sp. SFDW26]KAB7610422.1 hypothetical protein F9L33_14065 [Amylibacter sp. SFDW26]
MPRFSQVFSLSNSQSELDFVDIELNKDTPLYLDPFAIQLKSDDWSAVCIDHIRSFFSALLDSIRDENLGRTKHLLTNLREPNEVRLGESEGKPRGRGIGPKKAAKIFEAFRNSVAFDTGLLEDVAESELFIEFIGRDTISDLTVNVLRGPLCDYTRKQCNLLDIDTTIVRDLSPVWDIGLNDWRSTEQELPIHEGKAIVLVPKLSVRYSLALDSQEFYDFHMTEYLQAEYLNAGGSLVRTFVNGEKYVTKKDVKEEHPKNKNDMAAFVQEHPEVLEAYKQLKGAEGPLTNQDIMRVSQNTFFQEDLFARVLIDRLQQIPTGTPTANEYHSVVMGICTFLFYPSLTCPVKEHSVDQGRKRIDIKFNNSATGGFFNQMLLSPNTRSIAVPMECKNYTKEIANPELDQIAGRYSIHRGSLGFLLCRNMDNRARFIDRCRDNVGAGRGYTIVLEDADIVEFLEYVEQNQRNMIDDALTRRFDEIT